MADIDLSSDEAKAAIAAAVEEATAGLKAKNAELLTSLKEARKGSQIDPDAYARVEAQVTELQGKLADAEKARTKAEKDLAAAAKDLESERGYSTKLLVDNGLNDAMAAANVAEPFRPAVRALMASQVKIVTEGDARKAVIGEKGEALTDYFKAWAATDQGKHYVQAANNSGGSATGGHGDSQTGKTMDRKAFEALAPQAQSDFIVKDRGTIVDAAA